jgi:diguanylate cyclase (GGDEF)-like protein
MIFHKNDRICGNEKWHNGQFFPVLGLLSILFLLMITPLVMAAVSPDVMINKTSDDQTHFVIAVGKDSYPYQFATTQGKANGLMIDIWSVWAQKNGYTIEYSVQSWTKSLEMLAQGDVDFHAGLAISPARQQQYILGQPIVSVQGGIFVHQQLNGISSLSDLKPYVIGLVDGASHINVLKSKLPGVKIKRYPSRDDLYKAALAGEIKVFVGLSRVSAKHESFNQLSKQFPLYKKINLQTYQITSATRQGEEQLALLIANGLKKLTAVQIQTLERKWLGLDTGTNAIVIAMPVDMAPFMSVSANGEPIGMFVDIWKKWSEKTKRDVFFLTDDPVLSMNNFSNKKADIHAAFADDSVNANLYPHAHHIYSYESKIYYLDNPDTKVTELNVGTMKLGVLQSDPVEEALIERYPEAQLFYFEHRQAMVNGVLDGSIDAFVAVKEMTNVYLIKSNLQTTFSSLSNVRFISKLYSLVRNDNRALISQIKEGFSLITPQELQAIEKAWIQSTDDPLFFANVKTKVMLSANERRWLLRHPVIRLGALSNWEPLEFVDDNGELIGVTADLMSIISKRAQVSIEVQLYDEWSKLLDAFKEGHIDMVASMSKTVDREQFSIFTEGYWPQHWALVLPSNKSDINKVAQLKGKRLAVVKGYQLIPYIHEHFPGVILQIVKDNKSGFAAVRQGKADAFVDGMLTSASELREGNYRDLTLSVVDDIEPPLERIGVRKDWQPLVGILNKVIMRITDEEKKSIYENWFDLKIESGIDEEKVLQFGGFFLVLFLFVIIWNRRLQSEIKLRRAMEEQMKYMATHDELTKLPNRVLLRDRLNYAISAHARHKEQLALLFIDLDGFKDVNDTYGHDVGDELLCQMGKRLDDSVRKSDTAARFGGDEFIVLLTSLHNKEEVEQICIKLLELIKEPFTLSRCTVVVGASVGIAMYPNDGESDTELMKVADTLMYKVKAAGKNNFLFNQSD